MHRPESLPLKIAGLRVGVGMLVFLSQRVYVAI